MSIEALFVSLWAIHGAALVGSLLQLNGFLRDTPRIEDEMGLRRFKSLARIQMYLALVTIVLLPLALIVSAVLVRTHGLPGLGAAVVTSAVIFGGGFVVLRVETRVRSLQAASPSLEEEYRRVCDSWVHKALPDF